MTAEYTARNVRISNTPINLISSNGHPPARPPENTIRGNCNYATDVSSWNFLIRDREIFTPRKNIRGIIVYIFKLVAKGKKNNQIE